MDYIIQSGATDITVYLHLRDATTALAKTGLVFNSAGASCYYTRPLAVATAITLITQTVTGTHADGGFVEVDATNAKGLYRLDLPDAVTAAGVAYALVSIEFDGVIEESVLINLSPAVDAVTIEGADATDTINAQVDAALETYGLDHLLSASVVGADITDNSIIARLASKSATADWDTFDNTTDSLEGVADGVAAVDMTGVADAVWDEILSGHVISGSAGEALGALSVGSSVWDEVIEAGANANSRTARQLLRIIVAALAGVTASSGDWSALSIDGAKTRLAGTLDAAGNRTSVDTLDGST